MDNLSLRIRLLLTILLFASFFNTKSCALETEMTSSFGQGIYALGVETLVLEGKSPSTFSNEDVMNFTIPLLERCAVNQKNEINSRQRMFHLLAGYYYLEAQRPDLGMYWALRGAEIGSGGAMHILSFGLAEGKAVNSDMDQSSKWLILSYLYGHSHAIKNLKNGYQSNKLIPNLRAGMIYAKKWISEHPELEQVNPTKDLSFIK